MNNSTEPGLRNLLPRIAKYEAYAVVTVALMVLLGWQIDNEVMKRIVPGLVAMNPLTAICFISAGLALLIMPSEPVTRWRRTIGTLLGLFVAIIGAIILYRFISGHGLRPDQWLFTDKLQVLGQTPNRMAPNTAFCFLLTGLAIAFVDFKTKTGRRLAQFLLIIVGAIALFALLGYAYGSKSLIGVRAFIPIALHTATCFLLLSTAWLASRPRAGLMFLFTTEQAAGYMTRRLLLAAVIIPAVLGYVRILGQNASLYNTELGVALFVVANIMVLAVIVWVSGGVLYKKELEVDQAKDEFLNLATHQLQTPLTGVKMQLGLITDGYVGKVTAKQREVISKAAEANEREHRIVNDLLNVARADSGRMVLEKTKVDLGKLLRDIVEEQSPTAEARGQKMVVHAGHTEANIDGNRLRMAIENLVSNASKYTSDGGSVEIGLHRAGRDIGIYVRDTGVGIAPTDIAKIFTKFNRIDNSLSKSRGGTGLGMYLVKRIVELHGGHIDVVSEIGKGSTFTIVIPG